MTTASDHNKERYERLIFQDFARVAGLLDANASFESRSPPEPDILLRSHQFGHQAFELIEIVDQHFQRSSGLQRKTESICRDHLDSLQPSYRANFQAKYSNAYIVFEFQPGFTLQRRKNFIPRLFDKLISLSDNHVGELSTHELNKLNLNKGLNFLNIYRGNFVGPMFSASSAVWISDPAAEAIRKKTLKEYTTPHPLNLLAYIKSQPLFPDDDVWLSDLDKHLESLDAKCQFSYIYVFNYRTKTIERTWHRNTYPAR
jgi:hypothetical protein